MFGVRDLHTNPGMGQALKLKTSKSQPSLPGL